MKNIKKTLALVLVLVMALGMVPFAVAGPASKNVDDFTDFDDIEYKEAVDVLTALGVIAGRDDGSFDPTATILRSEAAKIISYVLLGTARADALSKSPSTFTDVAGDHWANPFIQYCYKEGIILGYGDGRFGPNDPVTATQMAKMLLMAMGYGTQGEFSGSGWEHAVITRGGARDVRVLWGTGNPDYTRAATREEIAQYTFNALWRRNMVSWNSILNDYSSWTNIAQTGDPRPTLGFHTFGLVGVGDEDDFGFTGRHWRLQNGRILTDFYNTAIVLGSFVATQAHTRNVLARDYIWDEDFNIDVYVNGSQVAGGADFEAFALRGATDRPFRYGTFVTLLDTLENGEVDRIIVQFEVLGQITSVNANLGTVTMNIWNFRTNAAAGLLSGVTVEAEGYAVNDYVVVAPAYGTPNNAADVVVEKINYNVMPISINKAEVLTARATNTTGSFDSGIIVGTAPNFHTVTIDSVAIPLSAGIGLGYAASTGSAPSFTADSSFYIDSFGTIVGYRSAVPALRAAGMDYIYVTASSYTAITSGVNATGRLMVEGWTSTGEYLSLEVATITISNTVYPNILVHNASGALGVADIYGQAGASATAGPVDLSVNRGFNTETAENLRGTATTALGADTSTTLGRWFSYELNEAKDRIMLRQIRGANIPEPMSASNALIDPSNPVSLGAINVAAKGLVRATGGNSIRVADANNRVADSGTIMTRIQGGVATTTTGISTFPASNNFFAFPVGATGGANPSTNYQAWLVIYEETATSTQANPVLANTTNPRIAKIIMLNSAAGGQARTIGVITRVGGDSGSGHIYDILRSTGSTAPASNVVIGFQDSQRYNPASANSTRLTQGRIVSTAATSTDDIYELFTSPGTNQGNSTEPADWTTFVGAESISAFYQTGSMTLSGSANAIFWDENTIFYRRANTSTGPSWQTDAKPVPASPTRAAADLVYVWWVEDLATHDRTALAVVSWDIVPATTAPPTTSTALANIFPTGQNITTVANEADVNHEQRFWFDDSINLLTYFKDGAQVRTTISDADVIAFLRVLAVGDTFRINANGKVTAVTINTAATINFGTSLAAPEVALNSTATVTAAGTLTNVTVATGTWTLPAISGTLGVSGGTVSATSTAGAITVSGGSLASPIGAGGATVSGGTLTAATMAGNLTVNSGAGAVTVTAWTSGTVNYSVGAGALTLPISFTATGTLTATGLATTAGTDKAAGAIFDAFTYSGFTAATQVVALVDISAGVTTAADNVVLSGSNTLNADARGTAALPIVLHW